MLYCIPSIVFIIKLAAVVHILESLVEYAVAALNILISCYIHTAGNNIAAYDIKHY